MITITVKETGTGRTFLMAVPQWALPVVGDLVKIFYGPYGKPTMDNMYMYAAVKARRIDYTRDDGPDIEIVIQTTFKIPSVDGLVGKCGESPMP